VPNASVIRVSDWVMAHELGVQGQVLGIQGSEILVANDRSPLEWPENSVICHVSQLTPVD
jgi:hypothetical protein